MSSTLGRLWGCAPWGPLHSWAGAEQKPLPFCCFGLQDPPPRWSLHPLPAPRPEALLRGSCLRALLSDTLRSHQAWLSASSEHLSRTAFSSVKPPLHSCLHKAARPQAPCSRSPFTATEASGGREQVCCCLFTL